MSDRTVVIVGAKRTPIGSFQGQFNNASALDLGAAAIDGAISHAGIDAAELSEVIMGCVLPAGLGQAPARQASLKAGVPTSVGCTTVNKVCGSGLKAVMLGHDAIKAGSSEIVAAGGMESMTNAPYLLPKARGGQRMGHGEMLDHMFWDGLQSPYDKQMMGMFGEMCADKYGFSRTDQDGFAVKSVERAQRAVHEGDFKDEIVPVTVTVRREEHTYAEDEEPHRCNIGKISTLRPAFKKDGTVTAANASKISDGAAATVLMTAQEAEKRGLQPLARIVAHATYAHEPEWFTTAPSAAIAQVVEKAGWKMQEVDLFEINEAFASVTMAAMADNGLDHEKVNVNGGACALGHPIGASGARILVTLIHALQHRGLKRGVASLCLGGGEAVAVAIEI
ncbi:MAG: acetyl-CoA C-acyltransferase [Xanthomonadales bacterium]|nr:acetyl-CoA C-acyltransferase [Gammaproteobacteria bacterium]NND58163.1 acetyl-CoA C-acyltransferase [Xanthomonadales bacterium]NNK52516.1 acetyl-CoA C-acyltransferase [Xanthomonadales bacterium]